MSGEDPMYELTIDQPNLPKGEPIQIVGLGTFENGSTYTITKDQNESYRAAHARQVPIIGENDEILGSEVEPGPTVLQASKSMYGVEVTTVSDEPPKAKKNADADRGATGQTTTDKNQTDTAAQDQKGGNS
jgi:hypothetical protein